MKVSKEMKPPDMVDNRETMKIADPTETTHTGVVKIMPYLKKVGGVEGDLHLT